MPTNPKYFFAILSHNLPDLSEQMMDFWFKNPNRLAATLKVLEYRPARTVSMPSLPHQIAQVLVNLEDDGLLHLVSVDKERGESFDVMVMKVNDHGDISNARELAEGGAVVIPILVHCADLPSISGVKNIFPLLLDDCANAHGLERMVRDILFRIRDRFRSVPKNEN